MRHPTGSVLIRSPRDIRLSRLSMAAVAALSLAATVFILAGGSDRSTAQLAALAALHERPVTVAQAPSATPSAVPSADAGAATDTGAGAATGGGADTGAGGNTGSSSTVGASSGTAAPTVTDSGGGSVPSTTSTTTTTSSTTSTKSSLPTVRHVFEIMLSTPGYADVFGHGSAAPYLRSLEARGTLLSGYESLGDGELADELAAVGGQDPNADTRAGCTTYTEFRHGATTRANGTVPGAGCVYPEAVLTLGDQVSAAGHVWKAYITGLGSATCAHPNSGAVDNVPLTGTAPDYDTRHNPFIYFHSLLDLGDCATDDVDISHLDKALASTSRTPTYTFLAPGACADAATLPAPTAQGETSTTSTTSTTTSMPAAGTSTTTSTGSTSSTTTAASPPTPSGAFTGCPAGQPIGIAAEDAFVKQWVPAILGSAAYRADGVLLIAFAGDAARNPDHPTPTGALVLSRYARRHRTLSTSYGPYSLLRSVEDMLGFSALARAKSVPSFASKVLVTK